MSIGKIVCGALLIWLCGVHVGAKPVHHYVFFGQDREKIKTDAGFLATQVFEGAQVAYSWNQLEPQKDQHDFRAIREDLAFLTSKGKKLFIQLQDVTFNASRTSVPRYLLTEPQYRNNDNRRNPLASSRCR